MRIHCLCQPLLKIIDEPLKHELLQSYHRTWSEYHSKIHPLHNAFLLIHLKEIHRRS